MPHALDVAKGANNPAPVFATLGDRTRLGLVARLSAHGPLSTFDLTASTDFSRQAIAKHLQALEHAGIVGSRRVGRDRVWELRTRQFTELTGYLAKISAEWDRALDRLRRLVEDAPE